MRTIIGVLIFFSLSVNARNQVGSVDSSLVIITISQTQDLVPIRFTANDSFPGNELFIFSGHCSWKKPYRFYIRHKNPVLFRVATGNRNFNGLLYPSDTLQIAIKYDKKEQPAIAFKGKSVLYCDYYLKLAEDTLFQKLNNAAQMPDNDILKSFTEIDVARAYHQSFMQDYSKNNICPAWFVKFEDLQIVYDAAFHKLRAFSLFNLNHPKKMILAPQHLVWIADVPVNNPEAIQTASYYDFLQTYFSLLQGGLDGSGISSKVFIHFVQTLPDVRKHLKPGVYDYYMAYTLLGYYKNASIDQSIDALVVSLKPEFGNARVYQLLLNGNDQNIK